MVLLVWTDINGGSPEGIIVILWQAALQSVVGTSEQISDERSRSSQPEEGPKKGHPRKDEGRRDGRS
jgi:hypothetical protein